MSKRHENLLLQLDKLRRHNRQGSFKTRERYYEAMKRFCRFLAEQYHLERLANIAPKQHFRLCVRTPGGRQGSLYHQDRVVRHPFLSRLDFQPSV